MRRAETPSVQQSAAGPAPGEPLVVRIGSGPPAAVASVGGKAASLDRLARLGHAVPPAIGVTGAAFRVQLEATLANVPAAEGCLAGLPDEASRRSLVEAFEATPTDPDLRAAIAEAVRDLARALDPAVGATGGGAAAPVRLAVRSSALDEDGSVASFAGLHETELGCIPGEVEGAIRRCWASLWSGPAMAYRARRGLDCGGARMAVVIQALVPAEASAVVFTRHPVTGRDDRILVTAIRGLGEPMVSGVATPDTIVVDRASRAVVERDPGLPGPRLFLGPEGLAEIPDPGTGPALDPTALAELVELAISVDAAYRQPVDLEAAWAGGRWLLLQARPITTQ
jgi:pyruvate,water dikinase